MVQLTVRIPDELHTKIKVIGVYENTSINNMVVEALQNKADEWERSTENFRFLRILCNFP